MRLRVREMTLAEADLVIGYFHSATPEQLDLMGVDPTRLPSPEAWHRQLENDFALPAYRRHTYRLVWLDEDEPVGISSCDRIVFRERANMHLHVLDPSRRRQGIGTECVRQSVDIYFKTLELKRLYCEPNALNTAPHRTLQRCGFKFVKTYMTVPGPINFHQPVTQWVIERS